MRPPVNGMQTQHPWWRQRWTRVQTGSLPIAIAFERLQLDDIAAPTKRKSHSAHGGLPRDSSSSISLVAISRLIQVRDESILQVAAAAPIGVAVLAALNAAVLRVALATELADHAAFDESSVQTFLNLSASTVASQHLYQGGLSLPSKLPWPKAKRLLTVMLEALTHARTVSLSTALVQLPSPPLDAQIQAAITATISAVEDQMVARLSVDTSAASSTSTASERETSTELPQLPPMPPPPPPPYPQPQVVSVPPVPFVLDLVSTSLATNIHRLVAASLHQPLNASDIATINAALEDSLSVLQAGDAAERRAILETTMATAIVNTGAAMLWACVTDAVTDSGQMESASSFGLDLIERASTVASALFVAAAIGLKPPVDACGKWSDDSH